MKIVHVSSSFVHSNLQLKTLKYSQFVKIKLRYKTSNVNTWFHQTNNINESHQIENDNYLVSYDLEEKDVFTFYKSS